MDVIEIYDSFEAFFEREFVLKAQGGMESIFVSARERFGNLDLSTSCIYSPSLMIVNDPSVENLMLLPTKDVMTINGDLLVQPIYFYNDTFTRRISNCLSQKLKS